MPRGPPRLSGGQIIAKAPRIIINPGHLYDLELEVPRLWFNQGRFLEGQVNQEYEAILGEERSGQEPVLTGVT